MGIGTALVLFAIGAILTFAVEVESSSGININNIGVILMVVAAVGAVLSMLFWNTWGGFNNNNDARTVRLVEREQPDVIVERERPDVIVEERPVRRRVVREEEEIL